MANLHFHAQANWINDPNGLIYYNNEYHLFFQYFPYGKRWGTMHWGHATSRDLIHWKEHPLALFPSVYDDQNGCFSGSAIEKDGQMHLLYTGVRYVSVDPKDIHVSLNEDFVSAQMKIVSSDGYHFDNEHGKQTIIPVSTDKKTADPVHTRDPKVWKTKDGYALVVGTSIEREGKKQGQLLFYTSRDLENWSLKNSYTRNDLGWMWECPDLLTVDGQNVLLFSPMDFYEKAGYNPSQAMGSIVAFDSDTCRLDMNQKPELFDYGLELYAPQSTTDENGDPLVFAWLRMPEVPDEKWIGLYAWPRTIQIKDGQLCYAPHQNIRSFFSLKTDPKMLKANEAFRAVLSLKAGQSANIAGLKISFDGNQVETDRSNLLHSAHLPALAQAPVRADAIDLEVYIDEHIFEVYVNGGQKVITQYADTFTAPVTNPDQVEITFYTPEI